MSIDTFTDKVAVVTGGASGIGKGIATKLVGRGARVIIVDHNLASAKAAAEELGTDYRVADVSNRSAVEDLAQWVATTYGRVDLVFNNAGVSANDLFENISEKEWRWIFDVNFFGVLWGTKAFLPWLKANPGGGHVVNTSSMAALNVLPQFSAYSATKFAVMGFTEALRAELKSTDSSVSASVIIPSFVRSNLGENSLRDRPDADNAMERGNSDATLPPSITWLTAAEAGDLILDAVLADKTYIVTNPESLGGARDRFAGILAESDDHTPMEIPSA
jgi:NAD(P)-dependent dehydrogenase (short-subunit alcohol dehydrogenase family)